MTLSSTDAANAAETLWQNADDASFWAAFSTWVSAQQLVKGDLLTLLGAVRDLCDLTYAGAYTLPAAPGGNAAGGPVYTFATWAASIYTQCAGGAELGAALASAAQSGVRRDAACDIARLVVAWQEGTPVFQSPIPVVGPDSGTQASAYVSAGLNIAGGLAFAVPVVGPYLGTALQVVSALVKLFFPAGSPPSLAATLESQLDQQQDIQTAAQSLTVSANWLSGLGGTMSQPTATFSAGWIEENVQKPLVTHLSASTPMDADLLTLVALVDAPGVLEFLCAGISTYLAFCRQLVLTDLTLAASAQASLTEGGGLDACLQQVASSLLDLTRFLQATGGVPGGVQTSNANWAAQYNSLLFQVAVGRLSNIRYSSASELHYLQFMISDHGSPAVKTPTSDPIVHPPGYPTNVQVAAMTQTFLTTGWLTYVQSVATALDECYATYFATIQTWMQSAAAWANALPLPPVSWTPSVIAWTTQTPNGAVWVPGAQVRYAVINANANGIATPGAWTNWITVTTGGCPTLQLQAPTGNTQGYWICRQVVLPGSAQFGETVLIYQALAPPWSFTDTDASSVGAAAALEV
ncbi:MAG TPA: hypothetical protein VER96_04780 [Polyangiaceae bacterium]|nr:hypothetical protein [Polyangiaceae bacterium]